MVLKYKLLSCGLALCTSATIAQDAALDPTFNPGDPGFFNGDGADNTVRAMALQSDGKLLIGGDFTTYNGAAKTYLARLQSNGTLDTTWPNGSGPNGPVHAVEPVSGGKLIIAGSFTSVHGTACGRIARLNADGSLDNTFTPGTGADQNEVRLVRVQSDGKLLLYGTFFTFNGVSKPSFLRLNANGTIDTPFPAVTTQFVGGNVTDLRLQPDGRIVVVGSFTEYDGTFRRRVARLNTDGSLDTSFDPATGPNDEVNTVAILSDGRILIGGSFSTYNGTATLRMARLQSTGVLDPTFTGIGSAVAYVTAIHVLSDGRLWIAVSGLTNDLNVHRFTRLNANGGIDPTFLIENAIGTENNTTFAVRPDGTLLVNCGVLGMNRRGPSQFLVNGALDTGFNAGTGAGQGVNAVVFQADGKAIIGGSFVRYNGVLCKRLVRVSAQGVIDPSFVTGLGFNEEVLSIALQTDGKVLVGGNFTKYNGVTRAGLVRLNTDGSLDATFTPSMNSATRTVNAIAVMPDGRIVVGGDFTLANNIPRIRVARFLASGALDTSFDPGTGPNLSVEALAVQDDGRVLIGGQFATVSGNPSARLARLNDNGTFDASFAVGSGANGTVHAIHLLPGGRMLIGGSFGTYNGATRRNLARLEANGGADGTFSDPGIGISTINAISVQPDGRIILSGYFFTMQGSQRYHLARVLADGALDPTFVTGPGTDGSVYGHTLRTDGRILIGGGFTDHNGTGRNRVALIRGTPRVQVKALLEGPYTGSLMTDSLRRQSVLPLTEPYTALGYSAPGYTSGATVHSSVLDVTGNDAIVDWVLVEMRPSASPGTIATARAVLLQRDGDVVDLDGRSTIGFAGLVDGTYCVAVRHRNHLPVMLSSSTPIAYGSGVPVVDFTLTATQVSDADARKNVGGTQVLAAGDPTFNQSIKYTGSGNDRDPILVRVGSTTPNNSVSGYWREDVNMDGTVKYTGSANDRDIILTNVGSTTPNNSRVATLP